MLHAYELHAADVIIEVLVPQIKIKDPNPPPFPLYFIMLNYQVPLNDKSLELAPTDTTIGPSGMTQF